MTFVHDLLPRFNVTSQDLPDGRVYVTPDGARYPGVTTQMDRSGVFDKTWLDDWRERVGKVEAEAISYQSRTRGSVIHDIAEKYLRNDPDWALGQMPVNLETFNTVRPFIDEIQVVRGLELPLWSDVLKAGGRCDVYARLKKTTAVLDFKNIKWKRSREKVADYFTQTTAYARMIEERYGEEVDLVGVIASVDHERPQIFVADSHEYQHLVDKVFVAGR